MEKPTQDTRTQTSTKRPIPMEQREPSSQNQARSSDSADMNSLNWEEKIQTSAKVFEDRVFQFVRTRPLTTSVGAVVVGYFINRLLFPREKDSQARSGGSSNAA